jgi:hypothetical protein
MRAKANSIPVGIVNDGPTRGDELATVKVGGRLGATLQRLRLDLSVQLASLP